MFLFMSDTRESLPIAHRIQDEGFPVYTYTHDPTCRRSHQGLLYNQVALGGLKAALKECDFIWFDINLPNHRKPHDHELLRYFGISPTVPEVFGPISDKLRRDYKVIGGTQWAAEIELDRDKGIDLAKKCGFSIPEYQMLGSCSEAAKFLGSKEAKECMWVIKPEGNKDTDWTFVETYPGEAIDILTHNLPAQYGDKQDILIQKKIDGVEMSSAVRWNGYGLVHPQRTFERKKLADGDLSCSTGSQSNQVYMCPSVSGIVFDNLKKLIPYLQDDWNLCLDANCIITEDGKAWFLEWTPREGWSSTYLELSFIPEGGLGSWLANGFVSLYKPGVASSELVSLWPYPAPEKKLLDQKVKDNLINHKLKELSTFWMQDVYAHDGGNLRCVGTDGLIGVMTNVGANLEDSVNGLYKKIEKLKITGNLQYRTKTDHLEQINKRLKKLKAWKVDWQC